MSYRRPGALCQAFLASAHERLWLGIPRSGGGQLLRVPLAQCGATKSPLKTPRDTGEGQTLLEVLDQLKFGKLRECADSLQGRYRALEEAVQKGNWSRAVFHDVRTEISAGLTSTTIRPAVA